MDSNAPMRSRSGRDFIARHGETVFNAAHRLQGDAPHTPLTRAGFLQADEMGEGLARFLGTAAPLTLWSSPAGRALQTLAIIAEYVGADWHDAKIDDRLVEIGMGAWGGRYYADLRGEGPIIDTRNGMFARRAPGGEWYDEIVARVSGWLADTHDDPGDRLVVMHGISSRILRGVMTGAEIVPEFAAPVAPGLPQGSLVMIERGVETIVHLGSGYAPA